MKKIIFSILCFIPVFMGTMNLKDYRNEYAFTTEEMGYNKSITPYYKDMGFSYFVHNNKEFSCQVLYEILLEECPAISVNTLYIVEEYSSLYDLPLDIVLSLIYTESRFDPDAVNHNVSSNDYGLCQLNDRYRQGWKINDFFNVQKNVEDGLSYLKHCYFVFGDWDYALSAYNQGVAGTYRNGIRTKYVDSVLTIRERILDRFNERIRSII